MKKVVLMVIVITMLAAPAFAAIRNTKHDLSSTSAATVKSDNYSETCVFCHTPHGATTGRLAPLWNRSSGSRTFGVGELYNSVSLVSTSKPSAVLDAVNASDAALCMSCHDGASLAGGLNNPSNTATVPGTQPGGAALTSVGANANINPDLTNDHPIGMDYDNAVTVDGELVAIAPAVVPGVITNAAGDELPFYDYGGKNVMWCSTCHDVHGGTANTPFLVTPNDGSKLCVSCHQK